MQAAPRSSCRVPIRSRLEPPVTITATEAGRFRAAGELEAGRWMYLTVQHAELTSSRHVRGSMVAMSSAGRSTFRDYMKAAHRDVLRWSTVIGAGALGGGTAAGGQAFRGHGSAQIVFGLAAVLLLTIATVVLPRVLMTAETDFSVAYVGASAFTAGVASNINMSGWRGAAVSAVGVYGLIGLRSRLRRPATGGEPREPDETPRHRR